MCVCVSYELVCVGCGFSVKLHLCVFMCDCMSCVFRCVGVCGCVCVFVSLDSCLWVCGCACVQVC